ncbi:MAG: AAA family ATPase [Acidobacteriota bacterium]
MSEIDRLHQALGNSLRDISAADLHGYLEGLEHVLEQRRERRTQLTLCRLAFRGEKHGDFRFHPGVNVLRAGNDKGKSSILKLIHFCLTGKNELKKDVDAWISEVDLLFELDGVLHALAVDKRKRPKGRLVRLPENQAGDDTDPSTAFAPLQGAEVLVEFRNAKQMQQQLEAFFNQAFGLRPLMGTQKASRKDSDALLDSTTSYRAYFRGMYINQDLGYSALVTDGIPYGNLFMKVVGMLLGVRGIDAFFAVEARRAHVENRLAKEERYHRRLEEAFEMPDLASLDDEIDKLERYIDELKVERTALFVRATSNDLDQRLGEVTEKLVAFDDMRQQTASHLRRAERDLRTAERRAQDLQAALASQRALAAIEPESCPVCETQIAERQRHPEPQTGRCVLCHEDMPELDAEAMGAVLERRVAEAQAALAAQRKRIEGRRADLEELEFRASQSAQLKSHLQAQLRSAHQGTAELDREIELETRYLGRLEARRENATRMVSGDDDDSSIADLLQRKQALDAIVRHLRTQHAEANERMKREFARRVQEYCTTIGFPGLEDIHFDAQLKPKVLQNGKSYSFEELTPGEKVRFVLAFYLALAIATAEDLEYGAHPGLLLIDSPGKEEMVLRDFEAVVQLLSQVEQHHADSIQVLVATSLPAIQAATPAEKQVFVDNDDDPLFG